MYINTKVCFNVLAKSKQIVARYWRHNKCKQKPQGEILRKCTLLVSLSKTKIPGNNPESYNHERKINNY